MRLLINSLIVIPAPEPESMESLAVLGIVPSKLMDSGSEAGMTES